MQITQKSYRSPILYEDNTANTWQNIDAAGVHITIELENTSDIGRRNWK